ncbi:type II toxin-antitoxin system RelE/ParE family toxin [Candidatus Poribacteria bacterium]|nr:type II toxin-antitoxin system RelE/ParE family toxin [Candidatus Poribacteria bacterium]
MEYRVITTPNFEREAKKLLKRNPRVAEQIEQILEFLKTDPYNRSGMCDIQKLTDVKEGEGQWRIRIGNYRVRYDIISEEVVLHFVGHRREAYRR